MCQNKILGQWYTQEKVEWWRTNSTKVKGWKKVSHANVPKKQTCIVIKISDKIGFKPKLAGRDKERQFILIKEKIHQ